MKIENNDQNAKFILAVPMFVHQDNSTPEQKYNLWLECLNHFDNPQKKLKVIQVIGTNGKGSTTMYLNWLLQKTYAKVATFTSPATLFFYDRIQINNQMISAEEFGKYLAFIKPVINKYKLNFFKIWTLIALLYFKDNNVNIAIFEAGIGGRIDATNIFFNNQLAVILTSVSLDHQHLLGDTITKIMTEKLAIVHRQNNLFISQKLVKYQPIIKRFSSGFSFVNKVKLPFNIISYQEYNFGLALAVTKAITNNQKINYQDVPQEIIFGRCTTIYNNPQIIIDGAHNIEAITEISNYASTLNKQFNVLAGFSQGKAISTMQKLLNKNFKKVTYVNFAFDKSHVFNNTINYKTEIIKAIKNKTPLLITGSLYFINEVYHWMQEQYNA